MFVTGNSEDRSKYKVTVACGLPTQREALKFRSLSPAFARDQKIRTFPWRLRLPGRVFLLRVPVGLPGRQVLLVCERVWGRAGRRRHPVCRDPQGLGNPPCPPVAQVEPVAAPRDCWREKHAARGGKALQVPRVETCYRPGRVRAAGKGEFTL